MEALKPWLMGLCIGGVVLFTLFVIAMILAVRKI